jgi:hypothetical protein
MLPTHRYVKKKNEKEKKENSSTTCSSYKTSSPIIILAPLSAQQLTDRVLPQPNTSRRHSQGPQKPHSLRRRRHPSPCCLLLPTFQHIPSKSRRPGRFRFTKPRDVSLVRHIDGDPALGPKVVVFVCPRLREKPWEHSPSLARLLSLEESPDLNTESGDRALSLSPLGPS